MNIFKLSDRRWRCPHCHEIIERDVAAALNILREGASSLGGGDVRPVLGQSLLMPESHALVSVGVCQRLILRLFGDSFATGS